MKKILTVTLVLFTSVLIAQTTFSTANFSGGVGTWTLTDNSGNNAGKWTYVHNPISTTGYGNLTFQSSSYSNGYMIFKSDAATDDGKPEDADLISSAINCSAYSYVHLEFDEWFIQRNASVGTVYVSTDNTNWSEVYSITNTEQATTHVQVDLSPYAANASTVYLKFNFQGNHDFFWAIDDIKLISVSMLDVAADTILLDRYIPATNTTINARIRNTGGTTLHSVDMTYSINGTVSGTESLQNINVPPFDTYNFAFSTPALLDSFIEYTIAINTFAPNGGSDGVMSNNTFSTVVNALSAMPSKNILLEEFTTAPCQFCPMGATVVDNINNQYSNIIPVALHAGFGTDAMTTADHSTINSALGNGTAPALLIDRVYWDDEGDNAVGLASNADFSYNSWKEKTVLRMSERSPLSVRSSNTFNAATRELTVDVTAKFYTRLTGLAYRLNCYIIEDSVSGSGSGYNQINYYNNHSPGSFNPWYGKGNPIVGYKHRHVARYMMGGAWGSIGTIPATVNSGDEFTTQYTYTLPASWKTNRITLVALVEDYHSSVKERTIINALEYGLNETDSNSASVISHISAIANTAIDDVHVFPNPASSVTNINYTLTGNTKVLVEVFNLLGECVFKTTPKNLAAGSYQTQLHVSSYSKGIYFIRLTGDDHVNKTLKLIVTE